MAQDFSIKYNGRGFKYTVVVNTDEDPNLIASRLMTAAGGKKRNAVVIGVQKLSGADLMGLFNVTQVAADSGQGSPIKRG